MCDSMKQLEKQEPKSLWLKAALREQRRINFGWLLHAVRLPFVFASLCSAGVLLYRRKQFVDPHGFHVGPLWLLLIASLFVGALIVSWLLAKPRFLTRNEALLHLDITHQLHTQLTSANLGKGPWPPFQKLSKSTHWRIRQIFPLLLLSVALIMSALLLPVRARKEVERDYPLPSAWAELSSKLDFLEEQELVDESYLEETRKKLAELTAQAPEDWFSHASLEATDYLNQGHAGAVAEAAKQLEQIERSLDALQNLSQGMQPSARQELLNNFDNAMKGLKDGSLRPNKELMDKLSKVDPSLLKQIPSEQLRALEGNLSELQQQLQSQQAQGSLSTHGAEGSGGNNGAGNGQGENGQGGRGQGGLGRGPGTNSDLYGAPSAELDSKKFEQLQSQDLSHSPPGDLLETFDGQHEIEKLPTVDGIGGAANQGEGGDRIWKQSLLPDEKRTLKQFFK